MPQTISCVRFLTKTVQNEAGTSPWSRFVLIEALATSGEASLAGGGGLTDAEPSRRRTARRREDRGGAQG